MSNSEFEMHTEQVSNLGSNISDYAERYINLINDTTAIIEGLATYWGGPTYDTFKGGYNSKLAALHELNEVLKKMSNKVDETAESGQELINNINSQVG